MSYHVNPKGEPGKCSAKPGNCPFGDENEHYDSMELARAAYELEQSPNLLVSNKIETSEYYTIKEASTTSSMTAYSGSFDTPEEAQAMLEHYERIEGTVRSIVKKRRIVKTITASEETVIDVIDPKPAVKPKAPENFVAEVEEYVKTVQMEMSTEEIKRFNFVDKLKEVSDARKAAYDENATQASRDSYRLLLHSARMELLALDVAQVRAVNLESRDEWEARMIDDEYMRQEAERGLHHVSDYRFSLARALRVQPEDVDRIQAAALAQFSGGRAPTGGLEGLLNTSWPRDLAYTMRIQPEDVVYVLQSSRSY